MDANIKAVADKLAATALEKQALDLADLQQRVSGALADPYVRNSLLGAGAGGLLGLATGGEDKKRKALHYALLGGLGGAGLTAGTQLLSKATAVPPKELQAPIKSTMGPIAKGIGIAGGAAGATAAAGYAPVAARQLKELAGRGAMSAAWKMPVLRGPVVSAMKSKVPSEIMKNIGRLPTSGKVGIPAAGALLMYSLLNGNNK